MSWEKDGERCGCREMGDSKAFPSCRFFSCQTLLLRLFFRRWCLHFRWCGTSSAMIRLPSHVLLLVTSFVIAACTREKGRTLAEEEAYHAEFRTWSRTVHEALRGGRSVLIFVDGPQRKKLGERAHLHVPFLLKELREDFLVHLILSESKVLASPQRIERYGLEKWDTSVELQQKWEACLTDYLATKGGTRDCNRPRGASSKR
jgi:hypothetical protein